jgi:hypothetical protein
MQVALQIAQTIRQSGLQRDDRIATVGGVSDMLWARLAEVRIVANSPDDADFWFQGADIQSRALNAFATTGAKAVVSQRVSPGVPNVGWIRIGKTDYYLYALAPLCCVNRK